MVSGFLGGSWPEDAAPELRSERRGTISASRGPLPEEGKIDSMGRGVSVRWGRHWSTQRTQEKRVKE